MDTILTAPIFRPTVARIAARDLEIKGFFERRGENCTANRNSFGGKTGAYRLYILQHSTEPGRSSVPTFSE